MNQKSIGFIPKLLISSVTVNLSAIEVMENYTLSNYENERIKVIYNNRKQYDALLFLIISTYYNNFQGGVSIPKELIYKDLIDLLKFHRTQKASYEIEIDDFLDRMEQQDIFTIERYDNNSLFIKFNMKFITSTYFTIVECDKIISIAELCDKSNLKSINAINMFIYILSKIHYKADGDYLKPTCNPTLEQIQEELNIKSKTSLIQYRELLNENDIVKYAKVGYAIIEDKPKNLGYVYCLYNDNYEDMLRKAVEDKRKYHYKMYNNINIRESGE